MRLVVKKLINSMQKEPERWTVEPGLLLHETRIALRIEDGRSGLDFHNKTIPKSLTTWDRHQLWPHILKLVDSKTIARLEGPCQPTV